MRNYHHVPGSKDFIPTMYFPYTGGMIESQREINILIKLRTNTSSQNFHTNVRQRLAGFALDWVKVQPLSEHVKYATATAVCAGTSRPPAHADIAGFRPDGGDDNLFLTGAYFAFLRYDVR